MIALDSQELVKRLKQGDMVAMGDFYDQYSGLLYSLILRSVADRGTAEDLLQEIFLRIWNRIHTFDGELGCFESWIVTVARNRAVDHLRASRRKPVELSIDLVDLHKASKLASRRAYDDPILQRIMITGALYSLSASQRQVLELAYFQGFTQTEIADHMGKPLGSVKSLVRAALRVLRQTSIKAEVL